MTAAFIGFLVAANIILWTQVTTRQPRRGLWVDGFFDRHPLTGVVLIGVAIVAGLWLEAHV